MRKLFFAALVTVLITGLSFAQGVSIYQVSNPYLVTSGSYTGQLQSNGTYSNPFYSTTRTISNTVTTDTIGQKIGGVQFSVTAQFTYTRASGAPSGVVMTEVSCDTGNAYIQGNWVTLYTDSVKNQAGPQPYSHVITGWPYAKIRQRYSGTSSANSGTWVGCLIIRYKQEEEWELLE